MKLSLAPLAGFTDAPFRKLCFLYGANLTYTEMVSAAALAHDSKPTHELLKKMIGEGPLACQIFGATPSDIAIASKTIEENYKDNFCELNLNAGCPMTKVTRCGAGAKLIEEPKKVYELLSAMKENTSLPITLKTRLGPRPDKIAIFELIDAAEKAGASEIIVHARFTSQMHSGAPHINLLAEAVKKSTIPISGNGSIIDEKSANDIISTGVSALMIGRAALSNPGIFKMLKGENAPSRISFLKHHLSLLKEFSNDEGYIRLKFRTHLFRYLSGIPGAAALRAKINCAKTLTELEDLCCSLL